ncbi:MAG: succinate dehydrogenase assembly factor 2 [Alphaproteobacteria bacterium]|nr:succinate dehydrogenase assembly factor 2 [Alphaproteobacteria bacterium]
MSEADLDTVRRRLRYRSWHRGCKETDLVFGPFADAHLGGFGVGELAAYEALLEENDNDLWDWVSGRVEAPGRVHSKVWSAVLAFARTGGPLRR